MFLNDFFGPCMHYLYCIMRNFVLPIWPGLPGRRDAISQWNFPGK